MAAWASKLDLKVFRLEAVKSVPKFLAKEKEKLFPISKLTVTSTATRMRAIYADEVFSKKAVIIKNNILISNKGQLRKSG